MSKCDTIPTGSAQMERVDVFAANRAEEPLLIKAWKENRNGKALQKLVANYQPMIHKQISRILAGRSISADHRADLEQEATLAFINAVNAYEADKSPSLSAFAQNHVRNTLLQYALDFRSAYRIGRSSDERKAYYAAQKLRAQRAGRNNDHITPQDIEEISRQTGASLKATKRAVDSTQATQFSIEDAHNDLIQDDHGKTYVEDTTREDAMKLVAEFLAGISKRNREIIQKTYFSDEEPSLVELSEEYQVSAERIGQIKRKTLRDLAQHLESNGLTADTLLG